MPKPPAVAPAKRIALAAVAGAHGIKGEVRLKLFADSADSLAAHKKVLVGGEPLELRAVKAAGKGAIARFDGISDRGAAEGLRGSLVEIERSALPPLAEGEYYHADLIGLPCVDEAGTALGTVVAVEDFGAGELLEVETASGKRHLIPFRDPIARIDGERVVLDPDFLA